MLILKAQLSRVFISLFSPGDISISISVSNCQIQENVVSVLWMLVLDPYDNACEETDLFW